MAPTEGAGLTTVNLISKQLLINSGGVKARATDKEQVERIIHSAVRTCDETFVQILAQLSPIF